MKLRLTAPGWETYTGQMGVIFFENGLSVSDVLSIDAVRVAGVIGAEWENGTPANVSQIYLDNMNTEASSVQETTVAKETEVSTEEVPTVDIVQVVAGTYTEEELAKVADESGITGLRAIATPLGVKGNSIRSLIDGILKAAKKVE
jgi:hypothetical protein